MERNIVLISNPRRSHEISLLLNGAFVKEINNFGDFLTLLRTRGTWDGVITDTFGHYGILALAASILLQAPLIIRMRGDLFREEICRARAGKGFLRWIKYLLNMPIINCCLLMAKLIINNSEYLARIMSPYLKNKRQAVVYNPYTAVEKKTASIEVPTLPKGRLQLLTVTNMNLYLKVEPFFTAITNWIPFNEWNDLDLQLVVCGTGFHLERLQSLVTQKELEHRIHILGWVINMDYVYDWCDVLIHLTKMDSFPNATMEAMMHEKPVITNEDSCGTREQIFDGLNGFVVKDADGFLKAIRSYYENTALRISQGKAGKLLIKNNFSIPVQKQRMQKTLDDFFLLSRPSK